MPGIIILAAGNSSRLGRPKQLLPFRGKTLLTHTTTEAIDAGLHPVVVVTGAFHNEVIGSLGEQPLAVMYNPAWEEGMAFGIVIGLLRVLSLEPELDSVIISVCDQPFISSALFLQLIDTHHSSGKGIIASDYADSMGTPVLFGRHYFDRLMTLSGPEGAKKLLRQHEDDVAAVPFPDGHIDIDTADDVQKLQ